MEEGGSRPFAAPYPMFACLAGRPVVVVGGGSVALRKARTLIDHGARVRLVSPAVCPELSALADAGALEWIARPYRAGDLEGALLAVGCTGVGAVDRAMFDEAGRLGTPVNIVDVPELCTFIVPAVVRRGRLQIAVSTSGASPSLARGIRERLESEYPDWWEEYLDLMAEARLLVKERVPGPAAVRIPFYEALASCGLERLFAAGGRPSAEEALDLAGCPASGAPMGRGADS